METKTCKKCNIKKSLSDYNIHKTNEDKLQNICKLCKKEYDKKHYKENTETHKILQKSYRDNNKEKESARHKTYRDNNKDKIINYAKKYRTKNKKTLLNKHYKYCKIRRSIDPLFKLKENIRTSIKNSIRNNGYKNKSLTTEILGCSFEHFKSHLESKFESWMNWDNYGKYNGEVNFGWDIDHIIPISSVKTEEEIIKLNHYINLQPLCSYTNRYEKGATLNYIAPHLIN